ncbi:GntR family transcriptional regulator [Streptomyces javensis]|uniref:GntR family transcriptional regulator n=1 Tax=Streptomyces javensis TaxID=114698 RepID=A0ABS0R2J0_9ACTN|nr:GntR family transcriptional regulator [Streptomyces javensis]MBI0311606.1 GntR family transcriptional regulator [Streptomyces javensis]
MPRATTAYRRVADTLREQIKDGTLKPGDRIGSLSELQEQFGVSDTVILEARKVLVAEGLLQPRAGDGTYVRDRPIPKRLLRNGTGPGQPPFRPEEDEGALFPEVVEEAGKVAAPAEVARRLGIKPGRKVVRLRQIFRHDGAPIQLVTTHVAKVADLRTAAPLWEDELSARPATDSEGRALEGVAGHLVTVVTRTERSESGRTLRVVETVVLADRFTVVYQQQGQN